MAWAALATGSLNGRDLVLYHSDDGAYMIRVNGLELMNSRWHRSEDELGILAGRLARGARGRPQPRLLLGGLGLGYTLAAVARAVGRTATITAAEISPDVIDWYERWFEPTLFAERPENIRIIASDVAALLNGSGEYDVILLDIDNGPRGLSSAGNEFLYSLDGLRALRSSLAVGGVLLIWSGFEAPAFSARAEAGGFAVDCHRIALPDRPGQFHYIYQLSKMPIDVAGF